MKLGELSIEEAVCEEVAEVTERIRLIPLLLLLLLVFSG